MKEEIIIYKESLIQSIIADIFSFSILIGSFAINHFYIGSKFLAGILLILWLIFIIGKASNRKNTFTNKQKAVDFLNGIK